MTNELTPKMREALMSATYSATDAARTDDSGQSFTGWSIHDRFGNIHFATRKALHTRGLMHGHYYLTAAGVEVMYALKGSDAKTVQPRTLGMARASLESQGIPVPSVVNTLKEELPEQDAETDSGEILAPVSPLAPGTRVSIPGGKATVVRWTDGMLAVKVDGHDTDYDTLITPRRDTVKRLCAACGTVGDCAKDGNWETDLCWFCQQLVADYNSVIMYPSEPYRVLLPTVPGTDDPIMYEGRSVMVVHYPAMRTAQVHAGYTHLGEDTDLPADVSDDVLSEWGASVADIYAVAFIDNGQDLSDLWAHHLRTYYEESTLQSWVPPKVYHESADATDAGMRYIGTEPMSVEWFRVFERIFSVRMDAEKANVIPTVVRHMFGIGDSQTYCGTAMVHYVNVTTDPSNVTCRACLDEHAVLSLLDAID